MAKPDRNARKAEPESRLHFEIDASLGELAPASARVRNFLNEHGVDNAAIFAIETAVEELVTNAIKYAFGSCRKGTITIEASATAERAVLVIEDNGEAFDPTEAPVARVNRSLEEMPVGGLGIHLVRELTDGFRYERINDRNQVRVWVLRKS